MWSRRLSSTLLLAAALAAPAQAGEHAGGSDQDRARAAVEAGRVVPLQRILDKVEHDFSGKMLQVELEDEEGRGILYEVKLLTDGGRLLMLRYDAASAVLLDEDAPDVVAARRK